jgi:hypothetical protein
MQLMVPFNSMMLKSCLMNIQMNITHSLDNLILIGQDKKEIHFILHKYNYGEVNIAEVIRYINGKAL